MRHRSKSRSVPVGSFADPKLFRIGVSFDYCGGYIATDWYARRGKRSMRVVVVMFHVMALKGSRP